MGNPQQDVGSGAAQLGLREEDIGTLSSEINAGFAFFLDCVVNLFVLSGILIGAFGFPADFMFNRIIPGAIIGIVVGNLMMIWLAKRTAQQIGNNKLTSIPLGIDLPTVFGMVFFIIGPVFLGKKAELGLGGAAEFAWVIGMASAIWMALIKFILSFFGNLMQREMPQMALVGAMAGIATVWLGAEAVFGIFALPEVGILSLMIMAFALIAGHKLPFNLPGAILAIFAGTVLYYILAFAGTSPDYAINDMPALTPTIPKPTLLGFSAMFGEVTNYLGLIFPFGLLIAASAVNVVAGARVIGDEYDAAKVVKIDSVATAVSAFFGGVVQTTPYFGHATYKRMGATTGYAIGASTVIAVGGLLGVIAFASQLIPSAVLKPILVVVASDIMRLAFSGGDVRHAPALLFAIIPAILNYAYTKINDLYLTVHEVAAHVISADWLASYALLGALSRGYILTSLIWGALMVWIMDGLFRRAGIAALVAALLTIFGVIHSVLPSAGMYLPWAMPDLGGGELLATRLAMGYLIAGLILLSFTLIKKENDENV